ncbi:MAG: Dihydropteroate synthase [Acidobacteriota bacterium]|nr:Dihydropteroate synthase [Acidobacteriota bacterium]
MNLYLRNEFLELEEPVVMGIINITPDSFSDGGDFLTNEAALRQAEQMVKDGAAIIDVGGESTRPGAQTVSTEQEIDRVLPVIEAIKTRFEVLVSVDTYKAPVARAAVLDGGADIVNDISGLDFCENMAETIAALDVPVVLMHIKGSPETMQKDPFYRNVIPELKQYFENRIDYAYSKGIKKEKIIIDPGIGFGKRVEDNIEIIKHLREFKEFDLPILIGISRKSFLGKIAGEENPKEREIESVTADLIAILNGANIIRVHNVKNAVKSIKILKKLIKFPLL